MAKKPNKKEKKAYERGFYEGGKITGANKDFWNANSPFEMTAMPDRGILRARARWLSANNAIMDNIDNAIINNVIGNGIFLQSITGKKVYDKIVEIAFKKWATNPANCDALGKFTFFDMQRLILKSRMVDGEIYIYKRVTKSGLKLQLIEADALDESSINLGIELDKYSAPKRYHFLDYFGKQYSIKAKHIINYFRADRPTQVRGISEYKQAILDLKNFSAFQSASIQGARARANIAYAVKQNGKANSFGADLDNKIQSVNGVSVLYLDKGEEISKLDPDSVATDYVQFSENTIRLIATARKLSYELSFRDYSKVNFASSRASLLQDFKRFDEEQTHFVNYILNDIFKSWLENEILRGNIKASGFETHPEKWIMPKWIMPKRDLVDPLKEITAIEKKIKLNLTCETDVANSMGEDYEVILQKKAREIELKKSLGIPDYSMQNSNMDNTKDGVNAKGDVKDPATTNLTGGKKSDA